MRVLIPTELPGSDGQYALDHTCEALRFYTDQFKVRAVLFGFGLFVGRRLRCCLLVVALHGRCSLFVGRCFARTLFVAFDRVGRCTDVVRCSSFNAPLHTQVNYPYAKLDSVATELHPLLGMENYGLITYKQGYLDTDYATNADRRKRIARYRVLCSRCFVGAGCAVVVLCSRCFVSLVLAVRQLRTACFVRAASLVLAVRWLFGCTCLMLDGGVRLTRGNAPPQHHRARGCAPVVRQLHHRGLVVVPVPQGGLRGASLVRCPRLHAHALLAWFVCLAVRRCAAAAGVRVLRPPASGLALLGPLPERHLPERAGGRRATVCCCRCALRAPLTGT